MACKETNLKSTAHFSIKGSTGAVTSYKCVLGIICILANLITSLCSFVLVLAIQAKKKRKNPKGRNKAGGAGKGGPSQADSNHDKNIQKQMSSPDHYPDDATLDATQPVR